MRSASPRVLSPLSALILLALMPVALPAQTVNSNVWVTNGQVNSIVQAGNTIYLGGSFNKVGPASGGGVPFDVASALPTGVYPKVAGEVFVALPDGSGGWYLGGCFSAVGGVPRSNLAHVLANGTVSDWNPNVYTSSSPQASNFIATMVLSGPTLYIGGYFLYAGGLARNHIAAIDVVTGAATPWDPHANGSVLALALSGSVVYAGGGFSGSNSIGGQSRNHLAALDAVTGAAIITWNPSPNTEVVAVVVSGSTVYAGGRFTTIGTKSRNRVAALDASTGIATDWNPNATLATSQTPVVHCLALNGSTMYVGGLFDHIGGLARNNIASLNLTDGSASGWNPNANRTVLSVLVSGNHVYAGGAFDSISAQPRPGLVDLDVTSGTPTSWDPHPNGSVWALALTGSVLYAGGGFTSVNWQTRNSLAAIDATTGALTSWNPNANNGVWQLVQNGSTVYAAGWFTKIGGQTRNYVAAIDASTGIPTTWNPNANNIVYAIALNGGTVYAGGAFTTIGSATRPHLAALNNTDGRALTPWNVATMDGLVYALATNGTQLFAGGDFTEINNQSRGGLVVLDAVTGTDAGWNPNTSGGEVYTLAVSGNTLYLGGLFAWLAGANRQNLAALDLSSHLATAWAPNPDNLVWTVVLSGSTGYVGGEFGTIGGQAHDCVAAFDMATGAFKASWEPKPHMIANPAPGIGSVSTDVIALSISPTTVYAGGYFNSMGVTEPQACFAALSVAPTVAVSDDIRAPLLHLTASNPARGQVKLSFALPAAGRVGLRMIDIAGRLATTVIERREMPAGPHTVSVRTRGLRAGVYFAQLTFGSQSVSEKVTVLP